MYYKLLLITRNQFERRIANNIKENPKAFWNYTRSRMKTRPQRLEALKVLMASFAPQIRINPMHLINSSPVFL